MTKLYLARHGETLWNSELRIQGHQDVPLSEVGRQQARSLATRLRRELIDAAYASDLQRAVETATIVLEERGLVATRRADLRETFFGIWEGLTYEEITRRFPEEQLARRNGADVPPPGGESLCDMLERVRCAMHDIVNSHVDEKILIVAHGGPLKVLIGSLLGLGVESYWKIRINNCSLSIVDTYPEGAIVSLLNDTSHLL